MKLDTHMERLEERTARFKANLDRIPTMSKVLKPLSRADTAMDAFDGVKDRLAELLLLMNNGEITPGDMDRLAKVFAGLRQYVRDAGRRDEDAGLGESVRRRLRPRLSEGDLEAGSVPRNEDEGGCRWVFGSTFGMSNSRARRLRRAKS